jgi:hypothetical protein
VLRGEIAPGDRWADTDRLLLMALERYERSIHAACGQPLQYSTDADAKGHYERHTQVCYACKVRDEADREAAKSEKPTPPGQVSWVSPDAAIRHAMEYPLPAQYGTPPAT